jgi:hypothetical protein
MRPVGPKLVLEQTAAPVPEIMDATLHLNINTLCDNIFIAFTGRVS